MNELILTAALLGAGTTRKQTPYVPLTPEEIIADAVACVEAGASVIHVHVRDEKGAHSIRSDLFARVCDGIREEMYRRSLDCILNLTTSGSNFSEEDRLAHLVHCKPEMCTYDPGTLNWGNASVFLNTPAFLERLGLLIQKLGIKPEIEIFDAGMLTNVEHYLASGVLKPPCHIQFVLGVMGGMSGNIGSMAYLLQRIPSGSTWSVTGIGKSHIPMMLAGLSENCTGLRVGLEDNIYLERGVLATNAQLVGRAVRLAHLANRNVASASQARAILTIKQKGPDA